MALGVFRFYVMVDLQLIEPQMIALNKIELNKGQIDGVPQNPRFIRDDRYKKLVQSITEHPEMMGYRELWVYPVGAKYVLIGGNQRFRALKELGYTEAPCKVLPEETPADDLRQFILLDNAEYGENDTDILVNEFEVEDLELAGIELAFNVDEEAEIKPENEHDDISDEFKSLYQIAIDCANEEEQERIYNELKDNYPCRILTL